MTRIVAGTSPHRSPSTCWVRKAANAGAWLKSAFTNPLPQVSMTDGPNSF